MVNPIEIGRQFKKSYLQYIKSGIPLMEDYYENEREELYKEDGVIMHPPYIEIVKKYEGEKSLSEICKENNLNIEIANFLNNGLLLTEDGKERRLYKHQEQAIIDVLKNKKNMVITTGTGSGKTESFLIPLLANIVEESFSWKESKKEPALRSIIFYPLNALAEDQMVRLRKSLAREEVKNWYESNQLDDHITFGRYISRTPKNRKDQKYKEIENRWNSIIQTIDKITDETEKKKFRELIYTGPCCEKNSPEMIDRETMQENSPDILITNYSMLNIMLMRNIEQSLFEKTRRWLENDKTNIFTLIIDELHTYRGTAGTEVAYIIKVLLHRLGLSPLSPQVRFLASSASMSDAEEVRKYISDFFGTDSSRFSETFSLITDKKENKITMDSLPPLPLETFKKIADSIVDIPCEKVVEQFFQNSSSVTEFVKKNKLIEWLKYALQDEKTKKIISKSSRKIADILFETDSIENKSLFFEIFMVLINLSKSDDNLAYQPIRAHYFLRNIEKIYICINNDCDAVAPDFRKTNRQYGKIYNQPLTRCSCGSLVYEAIVCRHCGELFFCGYIHENKLVNIPDIYNSKQPKVFYRPDMSIYSTDDIKELEKKKEWKRINFDIKNGSFQCDRYGPFFQYESNKQSPLYLPSKCPRCEFDTEQLRSRGFSALYKHGTGVQKVNQVCADTLMQILSNSKETKKLVLFSDSRQSAAKLSAGIELDHYRDALRQCTLQSFDLNAQLLDYLKRWRNKEINYQAIPEEYKDEIKTNPQLRSISSDIRAEFDEDLNTAEKEKLNRKLSSVNPSLEYIIDTIMKKMIRVGINPAGSYPSIAYVDIKTKDKKWYEYLNPAKTGFEYDTDDKNAFLQKIRRYCKTEILKIMIGSPKRSFESLGLGYYHVQSSITNIDPEFLNSLIRIIGESNRILSKETEEKESFPRRLWKYINAVKNETHRNHPILDIVKQSFINSNVIKEKDFRLTGEGIVFIPSKEGDNIWECKKCKTKHLHTSMGKCVYCFSDLSENPVKLTEKDLTRTYYTQKKEIDKLHCEELTGQTNTQDALDRQRLFQDILYDREQEGIDNIDLLSVTTTMEAGVDIGSLLAIMMGNVPPQRFNYQQRVGRAGRRGSPLSIALTVARTSSHDQMHYANPERIVSGDPASPYLDFSSKDIFQRVVYKEILKCAFDDCNISTEENNSVHGQFGYVSSWKDNKPKIANWLANQKNILTEYAYLINEFDNEEIKKQKEEILKNIQNELISNIDKTINDNNFNQIYLSERLAAGGRLPMFGFPTQVRNLYESRPKRLPAEDVTDRSMDIALATFAPGSEIVKDKKVYRSVGFIDFEMKNGRAEPIDGLMKYKDQVLYQCPECGYTAVLFNTDMKDCPICNYHFKPSDICKDICSPKGYTVDFSEGHKDFDGNFDWNPVKIDSRIDSKITSEINLHYIDTPNLKFGNNIIPDKGVVRTVNTNNGELFTIRQTPNNKDYNGWVVFDEDDKLKNNLPTIPATQRQIALVATKITGIMILAINNTNPSICLNPLHQGDILEINKVRPQLIKSAFLSWGELVRKSVTDFLDIKSDELSVDYSVRRDSDFQNSLPYPSIYMMEQLENGAGYADYLAFLEPIKKHEVLIKSLITEGDLYNFLIRKKHQSSCDNSCYDCLCDYNNQQKHGLLNWRLGLDIVLLSNDSNFVPNYTENDSYWYSILSKTENILKKENHEIKLVKEANYWYTQSDNGINFIYHPLWSENFILELTNGFLSNKIRYISLPEFINNPIL